MCVCVCGNLLLHMKYNTFLSNFLTLSADKLF